MTVQNETEGVRLQCCDLNLIYLQIKINTLYSAVFMSLSSALGRATTSGPKYSGLSIAMHHRTSVQALKVSYKVYSAKFTISSKFFGVFEKGFD